jgi:prevent-host-death family protein
VRSVSITEAKQQFAELVNTAQREPVLIRRRKRDVAVILSPQEYDRLRAADVAEFKRFCDMVGQRAKARGLTEEKLARILSDDH